MTVYSENVALDAREMDRQSLSLHRLIQMKGTRIPHIPSMITVATGSNSDQAQNVYGRGLQRLKN